MILIDALGAELAQRHGFSPSGLPHRKRLRSVLGFSQAALTSIMTGAAPAVHGLWMMYRFTARSQFSFLRVLAPLGGTRRRWVRSLIRWKVAAIDRVSAYYSLYRVPAEVLARMSLAARRSVFQAGGGGNLRTVIDEAAARKLSFFVCDYRTRASDARRLLEQALRDGQTDFHLFYTAGLDGLLHRYGTRDERIGASLAAFAAWIEELAAKHQNVRLIVLGDHGMCDVERVIDVMAAVEKSGLRAPRDCVPFYDSTLARFRTGTPAVRRRLVDVLGKIGGGRVVPDDELAALGVLFENREFGDVIFLCEPGVIILPSYMAADQVRGMHGYHPQAACMDALLCSNREVPAEMAAVTDLARYLLPGFEGGELRP